MMNVLPQRDPYGFAGTTIAERYQVEELLGMGGMAVVYRAKHLVTTHTVALKILKPDLLYTNPRMAEDFLNEARATAHLDHRNIVEVSDADCDANGIPFLAMRYLKGKTLDDILTAEGQMEMGRIVTLFEQICEGLNHAHNHHLVHRDIKPGNIMIIRDNRGEEFPKILDFGIAKAIASTAKVTRGIGTLYYASPEQLNEGASINHRSDIYSLGVVLFQMLTGAVPFDGDSMGQIVHQKLHGEVPSLRQLRPDLPAAIEGIVSTAMAKDPQQRYQTAMEMAQSLRRAISAESTMLTIECIDAATGECIARAAVYLNSNRAGQTDARGIWQQRDLAPKKYLIQVEYPGYKRWHASVQVTSNEETITMVEMKPEIRGDLLVVCGVNGAQVELDGVLMGETDSSGRIYLESVPTGQHALRAKQHGFESAESAVEIVAGTQSLIELKLKPQTGSQSFRQSDRSRTNASSKKTLAAITVLASALIASGVYYWWPQNGGDGTPSPTPSPTQKAETLPTKPAPTQSVVTPPASPPSVPKVEAILTSLPEGAVIKRVLPEYPSAGLSGVQEVRIAIKVSRDGYILASEGPTALHKAAHEAAHRWRFNTQLLEFRSDGKAYGDITFVFRPEGKPTP